MRRCSSTSRPVRAHVAIEQVTGDRADAHAHGLGEGDVAQRVAEAGQLPVEDPHDLAVAPLEVGEAEVAVQQHHPSHRRERGDRARRGRGRAPGRPAPGCAASRRRHTATSARAASAASAKGARPWSTTACTAARASTKRSWRVATSAGSVSKRGSADAVDLAIHEGHEHEAGSEGCRVGLEVQHPGHGQALGGHPGRAGRARPGCRREG